MNEPRRCPLCWSMTDQPGTGPCDGCIVWYGRFKRPESANARKLSDDQVRAIRAYDGAAHVPYAALATLYGVGYTAIWHAFTRRTYKGVKP